jgi:hypothetical protein
MKLYRTIYDSNGKSFDSCSEINSTDRKLHADLCQQDSQNSIKIDGAVSFEPCLFITFAQ